MFDFDDRVGGRPITDMEMEDARIVQKLNRLKGFLAKFNNRQIGDVTVCYLTAKEKFRHAQFVLQQEPHSIGFQQAEHEACLEFTRLSKMYESFLRQRSKITWLKFGDDNTSYFHASLKQRSACNRITTYLDEHVTPFSKRDVKLAMFSIHSIKSPGPDGFGLGFFKYMCRDFWDEISIAVLNFFETGRLPIALNRSIITLIPKTENPSTAADYRPIACCNTLYKCISKMLCMRLAIVLPLLTHQY
ncbi:uncharacterized protein LOC133824986 [Humulus lupulus]|uniref:uncharacterized protein LOC133824986 n=1 Tax=Humulus lupulus TaxID=3486 RepID=UPI002B4072B8|nr:uncharacterized protein LOC133824986 [Humulus lupulus]